MSDSPRVATGNSVRPVGIIMEPTEAHEAEGVTIRRTVGSEKLILLDPVLLLDHLTVTLSPGVKSLGFPRHPHRGIETLTYVFSGRVHHRDSLGNDSSVGTNGSQWMTAGGGIFHEEMLEAETPGETIEALQIWFNLPAASKMVSPGYQPASAENIPVVALPGGGSARVVSGQINGVRGPFNGIAVNPTYADISLPAGETLTLPAPAGETAFLYLYRGSLSFGDSDEEKTVPSPRLVIFGDGDLVTVTATAEEARFIFVSARPLKEPVLQYRSLVMNTVDQMRQALDDISNGTFARH